MPRGLVWDGEFFWLMLRVAFGDIRLWRSADALTWEELPGFGTVSTVDGPYTLMSHGDWLVAGGNRQGDGTVWILEGDGWREVSLGVSASITGLSSAGENLVAIGYSPHHSEGLIPRRHATIWTSADGLSWTEAAGSDLFGEYSFPVGLIAYQDGVLAVVNREQVIDGRSHRLAPLVVTSRDGREWEPLDLDLGDVTLNGVSADRGINLFSQHTIWQSLDGVSWTQSIVDSSAIIENRWSNLGLFRGGIVATGVVPGEDAHFGVVDFPAAWSYLGDGEWTEFGPLNDLGGPGTVGVGISGGDRFIANGQMATAGSPNDAWALYTFVIELPVEEVVLTWVNQTGLGQVDSAIWTERLDLACAEGVRNDDVAYRLAEMFVTDDLPFSLRDDGAIPPTGEAARALWIMAVNYCRADFPPGEIAEGAPTP